MAQTKATKRFEKRHLKDTLERRKGLKKVKQKQQLKAKKKSRRAEEEGREPDEKELKPAQNGKQDVARDKFKDMSVDDFFSGGFDIPELPKPKGSKRKRQEAEDDESGSDVSIEQQPVVADDGSDEDSEEEDVEGHKQALDALVENDPEFHKYLQENEPELLGGELDIGELSDDPDDEPKRKKQKKGQAGAEDSDDELLGGGKNELDRATVKRWQKALTEQHSLRATKEVVLAFRAAAHVSEDEDKEFKYSISSPEVYHQLLTVALEHIPAVFEHHLPVQQSKSGKVHVETGSKKFKTLAPLLKSQVTSIIHLLDNLSDAATLRLTLTSVLPLLSYLLSYKKLVRDIARAAATVWSTSSSTESTRIAAFLVLRRLVVIGDSGIRENVLKSTYQALIKGSRNTTMHTMPGVNLMKNSAAELWGLAAEGGSQGGVAYTTAFTFIRQLAIHLRGSITNNSNESYKAVYNWQYTHSLDFWSRVLASHATDPKSPMRQLIYPLVQVTLGALRLIPTATYFPLRFQLIRSLLRVSLATGTYIPLAPALYEVLASAEMRKAPKPSSLKPLDFATSIRAPKAYSKTRVYQDGVGEQVVELMSDFFVLWTKSIAFPELVLPIAVQLKRWLKAVGAREPGKGNKNQKVNSAVQTLVQKLEANAAFVAEKRRNVDFAPNDRKGVEGFLEELSWEKTLMGAYVVGQRKTREERARLVEEGRKAEESRRASDKRKEREARAGAAETGAFEEVEDDDESAEVSEDDEGGVEVDGLDEDDVDDEMVDREIDGEDEVDDDESE